MSTFDRASPAPRGLLYLASFNAAERAMIAASPSLQAAIRGSLPAEWPAIVEQHRAAQREAPAALAARGRGDPSEPEHDRQHRYVVSILSTDIRNCPHRDMRNCPRH